MAAVRRMTTARNHGESPLSYYCILGPPCPVYNLNFHPLEVVFRYRDPQLQVTENY